MGITFQGVDFIYQPQTPYQFRALHNLNLQIPDEKITAFVGQTGSGKSTLLQHLNALLKPTHGIVEINGKIIEPTTKDKHLHELRSQVGIVFQFPEAQLFEETVLADVAFGPQNFGVPPEEARRRAETTLQMLDVPETLFNRSPFELSGGQQRRVAIAGVLAMQPQVLVLDEPTAGLDPQGRAEIMQIFVDLHQKFNLTIVLVTHWMDDVANFADYVYVLQQGKIAMLGTPQEVFNQVDLVKKVGIGLPSATNFALKLQEKGFEFAELPLTINDLAQAIGAQLGVKL